VACLSAGILSVHPGREPDFPGQARE